ncbi:MAG: HlyD family efflux transporter periplasmic adaptor subunit [Aeromonadales bacterium]|nr:HlyD family efflux transporter periplasmic adaptor subunit [Aeromonadales bacterium]MDY2890423.1 HlyD family efflux transporter periplasmic adaptor subunit [Succinivibrio sp.]
MNKKLLAASFVVVCAAFAGVLYYSKSSVDPLGKAHGIVDIRQSSLAFERSGRITSLNVDSGDLVKKGQELATLDTKALEHQIGITKAQCAAYRADADKARKGYRKEEVDSARASVKTLEAQVELAKFTNDRYQSLYARRSASAQDRDQAFYTLRQYQAQLESARANLAMMEKGYREEEIRKAEEIARSCDEQLSYLVYQRDDQSVLRAPYDGQIRTRKAELGDMASASSTVYELSQLDHKRVLMYIAETQLSSVKPGMKVTISDAAGDKVEGQVAYVSSTAMFTPKSVQTEELRTDLVWEVRVDFDDPKGILRLGQPVTVDF